MADARESRTAREPARAAPALAWIATVILLAVAGANAAGSASPAEGPLSGRYALAGATAVDPPPGEARDTHFVVELDGDAARTLWNAMKARPVRDACLDDGSQSKTIGGMRCTRLAGRDRYRCGFAIDVARQRVVAGGAC